MLEQRFHSDSKLMRAYRRQRYYSRGCGCMLLVFLLTLMVACSMTYADLTAWRTAGTESDAGACYSNDTAHTISDDTRVEGFCASSFRLSNFGFTTGDIPAGSTIDGITVNFEAHGGSASQAARRRVDVWVVDEAAADCTNGGAPGRNNHQLPQNAEDNATWTADDASAALWGCTWADSDPLDTDFGIRWEHTSASGSNVIGIDFVRIQIDYTPPAGGRTRRMF